MIHLLAVERRSERKIESQISNFGPIDTLVKELALDRARKCIINRVVGGSSQKA